MHMVHVHWNQPTLVWRQVRARVQLERRSSNPVLETRLSQCHQEKLKHSRTIHEHWPRDPVDVGILIGDFNICEPEEGRFQ